MHDDWEEQPPEHDYGICVVAPDGQHVPGDGWDPEMPEGFLTVECKLCGQTTGVPVPALEAIDWG